MSESYKGEGIYLWNLYEYKSSIAIITEDGREYSYQDVIEKQRIIAEQIHERCLVFILCTNTVECLLGYVACITNHFAALMLDSTVNEDILSELILKYRPKYIWIPNTINIQMAYQKVYEQDNYKLLKYQGVIDYTIHNDLAVLLSTSGSTYNGSIVKTLIL